MLKNMRFLFVSSATLRVKEVKFFKTKVVGVGICAGLLTIGLMYWVNNHGGNLFGLASDKVGLLTSENRILKEQMKELSRQMGIIREAIEGISEQGNELRLMVDLKRIDDDTRHAAIGGTQQEAGFGFLGGEAHEILSNCQGLLDKLGREVRLQQASYAEIQEKYDYNSEYFQHIPAIKPAEGFYSINGFGMRIHPVLRVYRMHEGIDIINDVGTNVYASGNGVIRFAGKTQGGYGTVVEIAHGFGYSTLYAHLSHATVSTGHQVKRGELIGKSGRSGLVSGPHLHYEVRLRGRKLNPVDFFFDDINAARYRALLANVNSANLRF